MAKLWGYRSYQALARGVVTPRNDNKILLFVTHDKQVSAEPYDDQLRGNALHWEGPTDHFAEDRIIDAEKNADEIHLFYRAVHHSDFVYYGQITYVSHVAETGRATQFIFSLA